MILAALDDLMFTSRIRTAAGGLGAVVQFARTSADALEAARSLEPVRILLDLNSTRLAPIGLIATLKADPGTSSIPIVGFVSHVQTETIAAARAAGIDEVLARSAFVSRLEELLHEA